MRHLFLISLVLIFCGQCFSENTNIVSNFKEQKDFRNIDDDLISKGVLDKSIQKWMKESKIPGLSIAVVKDSEIVYSRAFGIKNIETISPFSSDKIIKLNLPVNSNTIFEAASLSKPVFAFAVLQLVESGALDLDKPLHEYLEYKDIENDERYKLITARMVLSHTSGFPNWRRDKPLSILFKPGAKFSYSGEGYMYLQKVVEKITDQKLSDVIVEKVFSPLKMTNSYLVWNESIVKNYAIGYDRKGKLKRKWRPTTAWAAGSLHTTALDYAKFMLALMNHKHRSITMTSTQSKIIGHNNQLSWGLGLGLQNTTKGISFWHWGSNDGFKSYTVGYPSKKFGLVYFTNSDNGLDMVDDLNCHVIGGQHPALSWLSVQHGYKISGECK